MRWLVLGILLAGCGGGGPVGPDGGVPMKVGLKLGTVDIQKYGDTRWVDIVDGQDATLVPGAQGGFHIWVLYRVSGASGQLRIRRLADRLRPDGGRDRVLTTDWVQTIPPPAGQGPDTWQTPDPIPNFMCPTPIGVSVIDQTIEMTLIAEDPDSGAELGQTQARVVARCPGDMEHAFCEMICAG